MANDRGLIFDLRQYDTHRRIRRSILSVRSGLHSENAQVENNVFTIGAGKTITLPNLPLCMSFTMYSNSPVTIQGTINGNSTPTLFSAQRLMILTTGLNDVTMTNYGMHNVSVNVVRMSQMPAATFLNEMQLYTLPAMTRIIPLGYNVTDPAKLIVQSVSFVDFVNDQVLPPSISAIGLYRICDSDGTPNLSGDHIMYLDDNVTQNNFSGTLQIWAGELV